MSSLWPTELRVTDLGHKLRVTFDNAEQFDYPAEYLRVESPSAEVRGHGPGQEQLVTGKRQVRITALDPVGSYAIRIHFSDGHATGLYTWDYLHELGTSQAEIWQRYLDKLQAAGASRENPFS